MLRIGLLLEPNRLADHDTLVDRCEPTSLPHRLAIDPGHLPLCVNLRCVNLVSEFRKKNIDLEQRADRRRCVRPNINAAAANVPAPAFAALQKTFCIAPGEQHGKPQAKPLAFAPFRPVLRFSHLGSVKDCVPVCMVRRQPQLYAGPEICKDDVSGLRRRTSSFCVCKPFVDGTLFSEFQGGKSLVQHASSGVLCRFLT